MPVSTESFCETCEIRRVCPDEETLRFVMISINYRNQAIITDDEFKLGLTAEQHEAEQRCREAKYKTQDCAFTTADDFKQR